MGDSGPISTRKADGLFGVLAKIADAVFPYIPKCVCCGTEKGVDEYLCPRCKQELESFRAGESHIEGIKAFSLYNYDGPIKSLVTGYKYGGRKWLSRFIGGEMDRQLKSLPFSIDCVCNVPLHEKRKKMRGFDQSEEIALSISETTGIPYIPALKRIRNTNTQTKLNERERRENMKGAFEMAERVSGNVLLIDDVLTTGATAGECARVLKSAGAENVYVMTFARALLRGKEQRGRIKRLVGRLVRG
ncbi:MAG: ComF family protein [Burkholderiales bacterium]